jgi:hypothetical protein
MASESAAKIAGNRIRYGYRPVYSQTDTLGLLPQRYSEQCIKLLLTFAHRRSLEFITLYHHVQNSGPERSVLNTKQRSFELYPL